MATGAQNSSNLDEAGLARAEVQNTLWDVIELTDAVSPDSSS